MNAHIDSNPGYFDPQAEALSLGEHLGRVRGKQEGLSQGEDQGYDHGRADGQPKVTQRLRTGIALGNEQIAATDGVYATTHRRQGILTQQLETQRIEIEAYAIQHGISL